MLDTRTRPTNWLLDKYRMFSLVPDERLIDLINLYNVFILSPKIYENVSCILHELGWWRLRIAVPFEEMDTSIWCAISTKNKISEFFC